MVASERRKTMDASPGNPSKSRFTVFLCVLLLLLWDPGRSCTRGPENVHLVITVLSHLGPFWTILAFIQIVPAQGSPEVKVTNRTYPVGRITLTCRAFNLCPPVDTLTWLQDGKPVQQRIFGPRTILPSGDGTYQTWASIWIFPGQESEFTCYLRHYDMKVPAAPSKKMRQQSTSGGRRQGREGSIGHTTTSDTASPPSASTVSALPIVLVLVLAKDN
ncbi:hereditary hemochromatosis protein-like isoform X2 [Microtus ochrogaster]|uniref:Hereditary hemochromatosis protein-like isoform X2 n=1 Tax=Microtus ochrogaster TaxID=79684 RepID=A0ABM1TUI3_MICOH|nr:hereditary hemochromatosis protein-like isoform X2 [Microtus ochrogaster]XP_026633396.1 hereditary hemochromatosis protein-like isoform X2 [Microtus ochrogaster]